MKDSEMKEFVEYLKDYLSRKTKRAISIREGKGKKRKCFFLYSPDFITYQKAMPGNHDARYTTGIEITFENQILGIGVKTEHCHPLIKLFKQNASSDDIKKTIRLKRLATYLVGENLAPKQYIFGFFGWSSKLVAKESNGKDCISSRSFMGLENTQKIYNDFDAEEFIDDLQVTNLPNSYSNVGNGKARGSYLSISIDMDVPKSQANWKKYHKVIDHFTPLFLAFFQQSQMPPRRAKLRSKLTTEYRRLELPFECAKLGCGVIGHSKVKAAHIVPDKKGGSDDANNGVFLCHEHHLKQEGKSRSWLRKYVKANVRKKLQI